MEGWMLRGGDPETMRAEATDAATRGAGAVVVTESPLGDPIVLAAALAPLGLDLRIGVRLSIVPDARHPAVLARDMSSLDLVCGGRSLLCLAPPYGEAQAEALSLCRTMWRLGTATSDGPHYPVSGAVNRPRPATGSTPLLALDLTGEGTAVPGGLIDLVDLILLPTDDPDGCTLEPA